MGLLSWSLRIVILLALGLLVVHTLSATPAEGSTLQDNITRWDTRSYWIDVDTVERQVSVKVTYDWDHRYDIDLFLLAPDGDPVASAETQDEGEERITYQPASADRYVLKVATYETFWDPLDYTIECSHDIGRLDFDLRVELAQNETRWLYIDTSDGSGPLDVRARWPASWWRGSIEAYVYADGKVMASNTTPTYNEQVHSMESVVSVEVNSSAVYALSLVDTRYPPDQWTQPDPKVVDLRATYGLFSQEFKFEGEVTAVSSAWFGLELGIPDKSVTITIEDCTNIDGLVLELFNPHGHRYTRTDIVEDEEMTMLLSGIVGSYSLRVLADGVKAETPIAFRGATNCPIEEIDPGLTSVLVGEDGTKIRISMNSYQRPLEVSLSWDDPSVTLYASIRHEEGEGVPDSLVPVGAQGLHGYYPTLVFGDHILEVHAEGLEPGEEVLVRFMGNYPAELVEDGAVEDGMGSLVQEYLLPMMVFLLGVVLIVAIASTRSRRASKSIGVVRVETMDESKDEGPADGEHGEGRSEAEPPRNYCAFCGLRYEDDEMDSCPECGRSRKEG